MDIQCENCRTTFSLDESLLKAEGSKVRCSVCKHVFVAYPPENDFSEEAETIAIPPEDMGATVIQDFSTDLLNDTPEPSRRDREMDFQDILEESLGELRVVQERRPQDLGLDAEPRETKKKPSQRIAPEQEPALIGSEEMGEEEPGEGYELGTFSSAGSRPGRSHFLLVFLLIVLLLVGSAAAIVLWVPDLIPDSLSFLKPPQKQQISDMGVRQLSFKSVTGFFVQSKEAGTLFVIRGVVKNEYPMSRSFILVKGSILDDKGRLVKTELAFAGNAFEEQTLKDMPLADIREALKNRYGTGRQNLNIAPGASVPFTIVFNNLPENLGEFTVEAVSSSPGSAQQEGAGQKG